MDADDPPVAEARALLGEDAVVGASCYGSRHLAMEAAEAGADYMVFGAFFPTAIREPQARPGIGVLRDWSLATVLPAVAIGGGTPANCGELAAAGADFVATVSGVWEHPGGRGRP